MKKYGEVNYERQNRGRNTVMQQERKRQYE